MTITRYIYQGGQQTIFSTTSVQIVLVTGGVRVACIELTSLKLYSRVILELCETLQAVGNRQKRRLLVCVICPETR